MFEEFLPQRKLGMLTPLAVAENGPFEFYRIAPPGVETVFAVDAGGSRWIVTRAGDGTVVRVRRFDDAGRLVEPSPQEVMALDVEALLIIELDGSAVEVDHLSGIVRQIADDAGAVSVKVSADEAERLAFWAGRKAAFPAVGRISPDYYCMDGTIPRHQLPRVLTRIATLSEQYGLRVRTRGS